MLGIQALTDRLRYEVGQVNLLLIHASAKSRTKEEIRSDINKISKKMIEIDNLLGYGKTEDKP